VILGRAALIHVYRRCVQPDDAYWRRPDGPGPVDGFGSPERAGHPTYQGPPPMTPPPTQWRPPHHIEPAPPRRLPNQDHDRIDVEEAQARTITHGVAMVAAALMIVLSCLLCGRLLF